ncbi:MAG: fibronectin type III domain-containing protein, partial [Pseudomonadota bacterium]
LIGYKIYYGRSSGSYTNEIDINNASVTTYVVDNLSPDTYYFAATAISQSGGESRLSGEAIKVVN